MVLKEQKKVNSWGLVSAWGGYSAASWWVKL